MPTVAIVGASGCVGEELIDLLRSSPLGETPPRLFGSSRSAGSSLPWKDGVELVIEELHDGADLAGVDVALFSASGAVSREWAPRFAAAGATVIDNSSAFRLDPAVPLVVPEINGDLVKREPGIIANPNCSTILLLLAIAPLRPLGSFGVVADTYQAVSGAGRAGLDALVREREGGGFEAGNPFPFPIEGNLFPLIGDVGEDGVTTEERKMVDESRKILDWPDLRVHTTCVRVPVERCHSIAVTLSFDAPAPLEEAASLLREAAGVVFAADPSEPPTPGPLARTHPVHVGRLRAAGERVLQLWVVGAQILKGAARNAVQIAELWRTR
ncbi:MAG: aspartate-semialdehyde dehydrogenase [Planctomycetota bacterium]